MHQIVPLGQRVHSTEQSVHDGFEMFGPDRRQPDAAVFCRRRREIGARKTEMRS